MRKILVATDFSERSNRALRRAQLLTQEHDVHLTMLHVVDDDRPERLVAAEAAAARELLDTTIASMFRDVQCEAKVVPGDPFDGIAKVATASAVDLIVMGAHRKQLLRDIFVGTSIERVARLRVAPVLMVNTEPTDRYQRSLVAVDLSEYSTHALQMARTLGVLPRSQVMVVHAFEVLAKGKMSYASVSPDTIAQHIAEIANDSKSALLGFLDALDGEREQYVTRVKEGRPADVIIDIANEEQADVVVMGAHGRTGILKMLLGSVTEEIMQRLDRDILVVPPARRDV
ncbi:MAG TPA: universal stress protein [Burkholderiales bacterium]|nr:universal stress protein [Burkholderiales bacterium]